MSYEFLSDNPSENSISSPGLEGVSSVESFSDIPAYVLSRLNLTAEKSCSNGNEMESCQSSQSGTMCEPSMESRGGEKSMLSAGDSPARIFPAPEKGPGSPESDLDCGPKWPGSLAKYDPATRSWKTAQCSLFGGLELFSETWPRWGMMRGGACWEQTMPAHLISENESGYLPTPLATLATHGGPNQRDSSGRPRLQMAARTWPTPQAHKTTESGEIANADGTPWDGISKPHSAKTGKPIVH